MHLGNKQTQALKEKEEGQRETDEDSYFPWNDTLFYQYQYQYSVTEVTEVFAPFLSYIEFLH